MRADHERLRNNLQTIAKIYSVKDLAEVLGINEKTWRNRMKEPWRLFSYDDLKLISTYCRIDFVQLINGTLELR